MSGVGVGVAVGIASTTAVSTAARTSGVGAGAGVVHAATEAVARNAARTIPTLISRTTLRIGQFYGQTRNRSVRVRRTASQTKAVRQLLSQLFRRHDGFHTCFAYARPPPQHPPLPAETFAKLRKMPFGAPATVSTCRVRLLWAPAGAGRGPASNTIHPFTHPPWCGAQAGRAPTKTLHATKHLTTHEHLFYYQYRVVQRDAFMLTTLIESQRGQTSADIGA